MRGIFLACIFFVSMTVYADTLVFTVPEFRNVLTALDEGERFDLIELTLKYEDNEAIRAASYYEMYRMYKSIGDLREAEKYYELAFKESRSTIRKQYGDWGIDLSRSIRKFRQRMSDKKITGKISLGLENNDNVTLEPVDLFIPTDETDMSWVLDFSLGKSWDKKEGAKWDQSSRYAFFTQNYFELEAFNIAVHSLTHTATRSARLAKRPLSISAMLNASHIRASGSHLMETYMLNISGNLLLPKKMMLVKLLTSLQNSDYAGGTANDSMKYGLGTGGMKFFQRRALSRIGVDLNYAAERPNTKANGYDDIKLKLSANVKLSKFKTTMDPSVSYRKREYENGRSDDNKNVTFLFSRPVMPSLNSSLKLSYTRNDSDNNLYTHETKVISLSMAYSF